jgi:hypothetical protein
MRKFNFAYLAFAFIISSVLFTSCTDLIDPVTPLPNDPSVSLETGQGIVNQDASINAGSEFAVKLRSSGVDSPLKVLTVQEAGTNVPLERIKINGTAVSSNPILLFGNDKTSVDYTITIIAHTDLSTKTYTFIVEDDAGRSSNQSIVITTAGVAPVLSLSSADSLNIGPDALFSNSFKVTKGTSPLKSIEVQENGVKVTDLSRLSYDQFLNKFTANPQPIADEDKSNFDKRITINSPKVAGRYVYTFIFTDEAGLSQSQNIVAIVGTTIELMEGVLLNAAGPSGTGGLDLDTGKGTGSMNSSAELKDLGIDDAKSFATNWKQQISGVNGSIVKYIVRGQNGISDTFSFDSVKSKEEVTGLFNNGVAFTKTSGGTLISDQITAGDILVVNNGTKYYLLEIKSVNVTTTDNADRYIIDIKK